ncbi:MAG: MBOAT family O-acyltransferase [bacterium]|jgi:alginate O-acetyltransferase complex protein AlgI
MLFSSLSFLYFFLPVVLSIYFLAPRKLKNAVLLASSLCFYFYGETVYGLLLIFSALAGYWHGLWINAAKRSGDARIPLLSSLVVGIGLLLFFKYADFFIININRMARTEITPLKLPLPLGISFYTFQILSYTIDVYRGKAGVQRNFLDFTAYVALFPQLIAGPIVRYATVEAELTDRRHSLTDTAEGISRFVTGLTKKVVFANSLGGLGTVFAGTDMKTVLFYWLAAIAFMLQIYYDFSGYSDMAVGLGRIFGFHFPENFNYPFVAQSISEFWRRWHISLGTWFRDYVYIPLGGSRAGRATWIRNVLVVWFLTGFWHGAAWNFIAWGLYFAFFLLLEKLWLGEKLDKAPAVIRHLYTFFFLTISFVIFNADGMNGSLENLQGMFGLLDVPVSNAVTLYYLKSYTFVLLLAALGTTPLAAALLRRLRNYRRGRQIADVLEPVALVSLLLLVTGYLVDGSFNPFLYFRF